MNGVSIKLIHGIGGRIIVTIVYLNGDEAHYASHELKLSCFV